MRNALIWCLLAGLAGTATAGAVKDLPERYQQWMELVEPLMSKPERKDFLRLEKDYQRDAFIERFWEVRDPVPETRENEFKGRYLARRAEALELYGDVNDDRTRIYTLNGAPSSIFETDCGVYTWPLEIWRYSFAEQANRSVTAIFFQPGSAGRSGCGSPPRATPRFSPGSLRASRSKRSEPRSTSSSPSTALSSRAPFGRC